MMKFLLIPLLVLNAALADDCEMGLQAYKETVFPKIRKDCAECHGGAKENAPPFAVSDSLDSYNQVLNYMNFSDIGNSLFAVRAGNGHCKKSNCNDESGDQVYELAQSWWEKGEKSCGRSGKLFANPVLIPANLPSDQFVTMSFDLSTINSAFAGIYFQIDIQNAYPQVGQGKAAYRVRSPRFINGQGSISVKNLKVMLNGRFDPIYNAYVELDQPFQFIPVALGNVQSATPVLSSSTMTLLKDELANPKLYVSFVDLKMTAAMSCENSQVFTQKISPMLTSLNCNSCHNAQATKVGAKVLNLNMAPAQLCVATRNLVEPKALMNSALISVPTRGAFGHPQLNTNLHKNYVSAIKEWMQ